MNTTESNSGSNSEPRDSSQAEIATLQARTADVGGISVHRVLPQRARRLIGAWCFLDHAGPATLEAGSAGMRVGPHPHTSLQTFTWMIAGEVLHRDSLGSEQIIRPGQLNLMTAGHGISHTEESVVDPAGPSALHAAQLWIALPRADRHTEPRFDHYPDLPRWREQGVDVTLLIGELADHQAPALAFSHLIGADLASPEASHYTATLRPDFEYGVMVLEGGLQIGHTQFATNELASLGQGRDAVTLELAPGSRVLLIGGEPLNDEITIWWNFVGHSKAEVAEAQHAWETHDPRFGDIPAFNGDRLPAPPVPWIA